MLALTSSVATEEGTTQKTQHISFFMVSCSYCYEGFGLFSSPSISSVYFWAFASHTTQL